MTVFSEEEEESRRRRKGKRLAGFASTWSTRSMMSHLRWLDARRRAGVSADSAGDAPEDVGVALRGRRGQAALGGHWEGGQVE